MYDQLNPSFAERLQGILIAQSCVEPAAAFRGEPKSLRHSHQTVINGSGFTSEGKAND